MEITAGMIIIQEARHIRSGRRGRINSSVIKEEIPDYGERMFYLCGPPAMVEAMRKILAEELILPQEKIKTENFAGY